MSPVRTPVAPLTVRARPVYTLVRLSLVAYLGLWHRIRVEGRENIPAHGGVLIVSNHQSFLDIPILSVGARRHVAFVARSTLKSSLFIRWLMFESGSVAIRQGTPDRAALEEIIAHLVQGDCVAVFPEGSRTQDGSLGRFLGGAGVAARRAKVPIVPAAISGAFEALPRQRRFPRPRPIAVRFGAPFPGDTRDSIEVARAAIERMLGERARAR